MEAKIFVEMENDAFLEHPATELARILEELAGWIREGTWECNLHDANGNTVGHFEVTGTHLTMIR